MNNLSIDDQLTVFGWMIGSIITLHRPFCSFLRPDKNPGCFIREHNQLCFLTDYAYPEYNKYTVIHCVRDLMNCTLHQAAINVYAALYFNKPINFGIQSKIGTTQKGRKSGLKIHFAPWTKDKIPTYTKWDLEYWKGTEVTFKDLKDSNIYSIHHFYCEDKMVVPKYPCYGYVNRGTGHVKVHQTQAPKDERFLGNTGINDIWEWNIENEKVLLTKSVKDALILSKQLPDWRLICFNNEGTLPDYPRVDLVLFDNDNPGIKAANKAANKFNAKTVYFEAAKDSYDIIKQFGIDELKKELKNIL